MVLYEQPYNKQENGTYGQCFDKILVRVLRSCRLWIHTNSTEGISPTVILIVKNMYDEGMYEFSVRHSNEIPYIFYTLVKDKSRAVNEHRPNSADRRRLALSVGSG